MEGERVQRRERGRRRKGGKEGGVRERGSSSAKDHCAVHHITKHAHTASHTGVMPHLIQHFKYMCT